MSSPANYVLGHSMHEQERLMLQSRVLRPYTERVFRSSGIEPGMRVLDLGSGVGDVALLAADIVGPGGSVLGIDRDAVTLERAKQRAVEQGCSSWVSFQTINIADFATDEKFDALVGRFVLLYQPDPVATLRRIAGFVKRGGIVAFHEMDFGMDKFTFPTCDEIDQILRLIPETYRRVGLPPDFGRFLAKTYIDAGLRFPTVLAETPSGGAIGWHGFAWFASTVVSLEPRFASLGLSMPPGWSADESLADHLQSTLVANGSLIMAPTLIGAWTRKDF
jgi:ubiquinone/menaquinone biosynthesis C-methylase UbiE